MAVAVIDHKVTPEHRAKLFQPFSRLSTGYFLNSTQIDLTKHKKHTKKGKSRKSTTMFSKILTLLICVVNFTSASPLLPRDASAEPVALPASNGVISGNQVVTLNVYSTSTNTNSIAGSKQCQTSAALSKLENAVCYTIPTEGLGINILAIVSGCKGETNSFLNC